MDVNPSKCCSCKYRTKTWSSYLADVTAPNRPLIHSGRDKMATISQKTFSNASPWMKIIVFFNSNFTEICSQRSNYQYASIGSDNDLVPNRWKAIIWTKVGLVYWCIYASLGLNELTGTLMTEEWSIFHVFFTSSDWERFQKLFRVDYIIQNGGWYFVLCGDTSKIWYC